MAKKISLLSLFFVAVVFLGGCASSQIKARKDQREKASQSSKMYCDFINGELYSDIEVMLNLEMAKRCDSEKSFSITQYKTSNENMGILYCCALVDKTEKKSEVAKVLEKPVEKLEKPVERSMEKPEKLADKPADKKPKLTDSELDE